MKPSGPRKNAMTYLQTLLKDKKAVKSSLETGADAGTQYMKEEDIADEREPEALQTLNENEESTLRKLFRATASFA